MNRIGSGSAGNSDIRIVAALWEEFRDKVVPITAHQTQKDEMMLAFFSGAWALFYSSDDLLGRRSGTDREGSICDQPDRQRAERVYAGISEQEGEDGK